MPYARPSLNYPEVPLFQTFTDKAEGQPDNIALIYNDQQMTYGELHEKVKRFATALHANGIKQGDKVCLLLPNSPEFVISFYGASMIGATPSAMNPSYKEREIAYQYKESDAVALITREDFYPVIEAAKSEVNINAIVSSQSPMEGTLHFQSMIESNEPNPPSVSINSKEDIASLPFTSGTTGYPKGVMLTHYNLSSNWVQFAGAGEVDENDKLLLFLPLYHIYGAMLMGGGLMCGATLILQERFDPKGTLEHIHKYRPTLFYVAPPVLVFYSSLPEAQQIDWTCIKYIMSGAAPLPKEVGLRFQEQMNVMVMQGYGMTEASPVTHCHPIDAAQIDLDTVGPPVSDTEQKIIDPETGEDLPLGEVGELLIRGPQVMKGYWKRPEENEQILAGGWLHTGDIAKINENNHVIIMDRAKNMIKYKGFAIGPAELEDLLFEHPAVADCAVIGIPDAEGGEAPKAFVVKKADIEAQELMDFVAEKVASYKQIRALEFIDAIPKNPSGKILKRVLVEQEQAKS